MKVSELLEKRRENWNELEILCRQMANRRKKTLGADKIVRFAALYRGACADLALADSYQLPPNTVEYLHGLVAKAHNQLYRNKEQRFNRFMDLLLVKTPQKILNDQCVQFMFVLFWGLFIISGILAYNDTMWPSYAEDVLGEDHIRQMTASFENFGDFRWDQNALRTSNYIYHNASIGLYCFAYSTLIVPGVIWTCFNAVFLGGSFGVMFRPDAGEAGIHFRNFVTAHGPFELTAIVLSASAGLRIGVSWMFTRGYTRVSALVRAGKEAMPIAICAVVLFALAAFIEGFISPSTWLLWEVKASIALISSTLLTFYFVVLGYPRN